VPSREIWVFPEINNQDAEISKFSLGLLTEANYVARKVDGNVTAVIFGDSGESFNKILGQYGVNQALIFKHTGLKYFNTDLYSSILAEKINADKPWIFLMGNSTAGKELAPRLSAMLDTGLVPGCVKMDLSNPERPIYFRPTLGDQAYQEIIFQSPGTMLVTMAPGVLNIASSIRPTEVKTLTIEPTLEIKVKGIHHLDYLPADFKTIDVADAGTIVSAGAGAATDEILPLVEELAALIEGAIGTTRPVVDEGKIDRERMIGQTGKIVSPDLYFALGISGATHHVGGIQDSHTIIAVNRDPQAPIFQNADVGVVADLKAVLPGLIEKIKQAKKDGKIL
jgi:electron transfer flavoprotein alpha subunit